MSQKFRSTATFQLNITKTKEMVLALWENGSQPNSVSFQGEDVVVVDFSKYRDVQLNNIQEWLRSTGPEHTLVPEAA